MSTPTQADIDSLPSFFKPAKDGTSAFDIRPISRPPGMPNPSSKPRDLNGVYDSTFAYADAQPTVGAATTAPTAAPVSTSFNQARCAPIYDTGAFHPPGQIIQTRTDVVLLEEFQHEYLHIYMRTTPPRHLKPSHMGFTIGHWEGNVLVTETYGLLSGLSADGHPVGPTTRVIHRLHKLSNGDIEKEVAYFDLQSQTAKSVSRLVLHWRPDLVLLEDICEDFGEAYGDTYRTPAAPDLHSGEAK